VLRLPSALTTARLATALTFCVVVLGAYVRLVDAGLSCPDWPGCYGHLVVPADAEARRQAELAYPQTPLDPVRAWKEMLHRYLAGMLGLLILFLAVRAWQERHRLPRAWMLALILPALVTMQALLGMWTVTLLLRPWIVTAHLLGGMLILAGLWWLSLSLRHAAAAPAARTPEAGGGGERGVNGPLRTLALLGLVVAFLPIALAGRPSANYAALACPDFPTCHGRWWPQEMDLEGAFSTEVLFAGSEAVSLDSAQRVTVQVVHRMGAMLVLLVVGAAAAFGLLRGGPGMRPCAGALLVLLLMQLGVGIANVLLHLPLFTAVAHKAVAALLLLRMATLLHRTLISPLQAAP